ncbi:MAG: response regulator [Fibrobacterales bacterium]
MKFKILIVDDDEINIEILEDILEDNYIVQVASDGESALGKMESFIPDVVLLDIMMPGIDGYEVCRRIRNNNSFKYVKVLLVSAKAMLQERLEGYAAGADDYVTKPFDHNELLAKVQIFVKLKYEEEVDRLKGDLLHLLSHEKRTPLNSILGLSELLLSSSENLNAEERSYIKEIQKAGFVLLSQTEKTLSMCMFKKGMDLDVEKSSIEEAIKGATKQVQKMNSERNISIHYSIPNVEPFEFEPYYIENAVRYLIENAYDHSPEGGTIDISVIPNGVECAVVIEDEGPGIKPEKLETVFNEFNSEDIMHHTRGLGISLPLSKKIAESHNGTLTIENREDGGIKVQFTIPYLMGG